MRKELGAKQSDGVFVCLVYICIKDELYIVHIHVYICNTPLYAPYAKILKVNVQICTAIDLKLGPLK